MPHLFANNFQCPAQAQCSENTQRAIAFITSKLQSTYPEAWEKLVVRYDVSVQEQPEASSPQATPEASPQELAKWLASPQAADKTVNCFIQYQPDCDPRAQNVAALMPHLFANNFQCPAQAQCSENTQRAIAFITGTLQTTYPEAWQKLTTHYNN